MGLLIDRDKPQLDPYRRHIKTIEECVPYGQIKRQIGRRKESQWDRHERWLRDKAKGVPNRSKVLSDEQIMQIKKLKELGWNLTQIHKEFDHVSYSSVCKACKGGYDE
jgi:hypothetical protein